MNPVLSDLRVKIQPGCIGREVGAVLQVLAAFDDITRIAADLCEFSISNLIGVYQVSQRCPMADWWKLINIADQKNVGFIREGSAETCECIHVAH